MHPGVISNVLSRIVRPFLRVEGSGFYAADLAVYLSATSPHGTSRMGDSCPVVWCWWHMGITKTAEHRQMEYTHDAIRPVIRFGSRPTVLPVILPAQRCA